MVRSCLTRRSPTWQSTLRWTNWLRDRCKTSTSRSSPRKSTRALKNQRRSTSIMNHIVQPNQRTKSSVSTYVILSLPQHSNQPKSQQNLKKHQLKIRLQEIEEQWVSRLRLRLQERRVEPFPDQWTECRGGVVHDATEEGDQWFWEAKEEGRSWLL